MYQPFPSILFAMACRTGVCEELKLNEIVELLSTEDNVISNKITKPRAGDIYVAKTTKMVRNYIFFVHEHPSSAQYTNSASIRRIYHHFVE
jgi:hypothetical protein